MSHAADDEVWTLTTSLAAEDFGRYEKHHRTSQQWLLIVLASIGAMACVLMAIGVTTGVSKEPALGIGAGALVSVGLAAALKREKNVRLRTLSDKFIPYVLSLSRSGIVQKIGRTETKYIWSEVERVERNADFLELVTWDGHTFLLPKCSFAEADKFEQCYEFVIKQHKGVMVGHA